MFCKHALHRGLTPRKIRWRSPTTFPLSREQDAGEAALEAGEHHDHSQHFGKCFGLAIPAR